MDARREAKARPTEASRGMIGEIQAKQGKPTCMSVWRGGAAGKKICLLEMRERMRFSKRSRTSSLPNAHRERETGGCYVMLRDVSTNS